uniref:Uncharacterized protein n=1 Tax=Populus trichocarpa TaxID=3694 RepID=A0A2K1YKB6_POPTR
MQTNPSHNEFNHPPSKFKFDELISLSCQVANYILPRSNENSKHSQQKKWIQLLPRSNENSKHSQQKKWIQLSYTTTKLLQN